MIKPSMCMTQARQNFYDFGGYGLVARACLFGFRAARALERGESCERDSSGTTCGAKRRK
jgi:hypothetical protein